MIVVQGAYALPDGARVKPEEQAPAVGPEVPVHDAAAP